VVLELVLVLEQLQTLVSTLMLLPLLASNLGAVDSLHWSGGWWWQGV